MGTYLIKDLNDFVAKSVHDVHNVFRHVNTGGKKRRAAYVLHLGKRANLSSAAGELMRCLRGVLRPGEYLDTANDCFTIAGPTFRITYVLEGTGKQPMFTVGFKNSEICMVPLHRMGISWCKRLLRKRRRNTETVESSIIESHMEDPDMLQHFPNPSDRYVAIYRWLTGKLVIASTMERVVELAALGEGSRIEFKIASQGVHDDVFETICSFGNGLGGDILLGVNDDGVVVGMSKEAIESSKRDVKRFCSAKGLFSAPVRVGVAEHIVNGHRVLHIRVPKAPAKLQYKGVAYIRRGDADYKA